MTATRVTWCTGRFRFAVTICGVDLKYPRKQKMQLQIAEIKVCGGQISVSQPANFCQGPGNSRNPSALISER